MSKVQDYHCMFVLQSGLFATRQTSEGLDHHSRYLAIEQRLTYFGVPIDRIVGPSPLYRRQVRLRYETNL